jgi:formylglycine-generating enzyme required for sulfatase activity
MVMVLYGAAYAISMPEISISGKITDSSGNAGLSGVRVSLKKFPRIVALTDANGFFMLTKSSAVRPNVNNGGFLLTAPYVRNDRLVFNAVAAVRTGAVEVFSMNGARLSVRRLHDLRSGSHSVVLPEAAHGATVVKLTVGHESYLVRSVMGIQGKCPSAGGESFLSRRTSAYGGTIAATPVDTVIVFARGYKHAFAGITTYAQTDIKAALALSNPWKPTGPLTHEKGMVKILAKGYDFEMGQPDPFFSGNIVDSSNTEQPVHTVMFSHDFWLDTTEVTQKDFDSLMKATYKGEYWAPPWAKPFGVGSSYAAYNVSWGDAALYCNARSKCEGLLDTAYSYRSIAGQPGQNCLLVGISTDFSKNAYRLPTEAEWEYACKGGTATDYYWGKIFSSSYPSTSADTAEIGQYAKWIVNGYFLGQLDTNFGADKVARRKPNAYGLYDMIGNVTEFCNDYWGDYGWETEIDPKGPNLDPDKVEVFETLRGGNWGAAAFYLRNSNRLFTASDYPYNFKGFRVCKSIN